MTLNDPYPQFQGHTIFWPEYLRNSTVRHTDSLNEILIGTNTTQQCHFEWPWVTIYSMTQSVLQSLCSSWASCFDKKWANWHDFEKNAAEYFDTSHQVFAKLDSRTVENQNERLSVTAIKYSKQWTEVCIRPGYVRPAVCIALVCLCIQLAVCIKFCYVCTRPAVCIASVLKKKTGFAYRGLCVTVTHAPLQIIVPRLCPSKKNFWRRHCARLQR